MKVASIGLNPQVAFSGSNDNRKSFNVVTWTGYGAVALGVASGVAAHKKNIKLHKTLAYLAGILTLAHIGIVEIKKFRYRQSQK